MKYKEITTKKKSSILLNLSDTHHQIGELRIMSFVKYNKNYDQIMNPEDAQWA